MYQFFIYLTKLQSLPYLTSLSQHYFLFFFFTYTSTPEIYTLSLHDALPISAKGDDNERIEGLEAGADDNLPKPFNPDRKSTRLNSSHVAISYAVFCLKKKKNNKRIYKIKS